MYACTTSHLLHYKDKRSTAGTTAARFRSSASTERGQTRNVKHLSLAIMRNGRAL